MRFVFSNLSTKILGILMNNEWYTFPTTYMPKLLVKLAIHGYVYDHRPCDTEYEHHTVRHLIKIKKEIGDEIN